jgi:hypothetical protein
MKQCAQILEQLKQYNEAAVLYEQGRFFDRAAAACIKAKNWSVLFVCGYFKTLEYVQVKSGHTVDTRPLG